MIEKLVLEFINNHDPMSKEIILDKISSLVRIEDIDNILVTLDSIENISALEYSMILNVIAKPGFTKLESIISKRLEETKDIDAIEELNEAQSKLKE
jgi:hypothetical protein